MARTIPNYFRDGDGAFLNEAGGSQVFTRVLAGITLAQINAGYTVLSGVAGQQIMIVGGRLKSSGAFAALTAIELQESDGSPVIVTWAQAQLTDGAVFDLRNTITGQTIGAGFGTALTSGKGVVITKTGSAGTTATGVDLIVDYIVV